MHSGQAVLIQRLSGAGDAAFLSLLEPHGRYDAATETTTGSRSGVAGGADAGCATGAGVAANAEAVKRTTAKQKASDQDAPGAPDPTSKEGGQ